MSDTKPAPSTERIVLNGVAGPLFGDDRRGLPVYTIQRGRATQAAEALIAERDAIADDEQACFDDLTAAEAQVRVLRRALTDLGRQWHDIRSNHKDIAFEDCRVGFCLDTNNALANTEPQP